MNNILKKIPYVITTVRFFRSILGLTPEVLSKRYFVSQRDILINQYIKNNLCKKLHIGCQATPIESWLNVDLLPLTKEIVIMDATKPFCFENNTFDFIFSEHMLEHISFKEGNFMLSECSRVLKNGGKLRLSTPDLNFLINIYLFPNSDIHLKYREFSVKYLEESSTPGLPSVVLNNFFRNWGHKFIYDKESITYLLQKNGFKNITFYEVGKSNFPELNNLERHGMQISDEFNELESLVVEAEK